MKKEFFSISKTARCVTDWWKSLKVHSCIVLPLLSQPSQASESLFPMEHSFTHKFSAIDAIAHVCSLPRGPAAMKSTVVCEEKRVCFTLYLKIQSLLKVF